VGCGGGDEEDPEELLDRAFERPLESMDVRLEAELSLEGIDGIDEPIRFLATGPYSSGDDDLPSFDLDLEIRADASGQPVSTGALSTGDRTFLKFGDTYYEVDSEDAGGDRQANRCRRSGIGVNPRPWVEDAETEDDADVSGTKTAHVSGTLDVERMLRGLNEFVVRCGRLLGTAAGQLPGLSEKQIDQAGQVVGDPGFDVYVAKEDGIIRRISANVELDVPEAFREGLNGLESGSLKFSIEFSDVNGDQQIEAPARPRPIAELENQLGAGAIGGGVVPAQPPSRDGQGRQPSVDEYQNYVDCLDQADPDDTDALRRCSALLNAP
jgi:hypothetical protein